MTLSLVLLMTVERIQRAAQDGFTQTVSGVDLIVGARSGPLQLILYSVFNIGQATQNVSIESYNDIKSRPEVEWTIPYSLGDGHHGFRVVATNTDFFKHYQFRSKEKFEFTAGKIFENYFDVKPGDMKATKELEDKLRLAQDAREKVLNSVKTAQDNLNKSTEYSLKPLEAQQKILEANLKTLQNAQKAKQQENSFATTKTDLKNQIMMAQANGDNLKAQLLQQELMAKSQDYGFQQKIDEAQGKVDANKAQIEAIKDNAAKVSKAVSDGATKVANAVSQPAPTDTKMGTSYKDAIPLRMSRADAIAAVNFMGLSAVKKFVLKQGIEEGQTFSIDDGKKTHVFKLTNEGKIIRMAPGESKPKITGNPASSYLNPNAPGNQSATGLDLSNFLKFNSPTFKPPTTGKSSLPQLGFNNQSVNTGGITINTNVTVDAAGGVDMDKFKKFLEKHDIDLVNKIKMSGAVNKVGK
jgi:hypothetical protein